MRSTTSAGRSTTGEERTRFTAYLTPQDTDFGKSLIRFADESFVNEEAEEWLAFQVATTFGLDKAPMDERIQWVRDNHDLITKVAVDPIGNLPEWEVVEEPWQFMAACHEGTTIAVSSVITSSHPSWLLLMQRVVDYRSWLV